MSVALCTFYVLESAANKVPCFQELKFAASQQFATADRTRTQAIHLILLNETKTKRHFLFFFFFFHYKISNDDRFIMLSFSVCF